MIEDTIAAISTPMGTGGISIVRLSGPNAIEIGGSAVRLRSGAPLSSARSWSAKLGTAIDRDGVVLDEVIVLIMRGPHSYTGEDSVEVQCHGGPLVSQKVLLSLLEGGARHAEPGEFTKRAFLNDRITLEAAEAVLDVVTAPTEAALVQAGKRLRGELGSRVSKWEQRLYGALAALQGAVDFPEEIEEVSASALSEVRAVYRETSEVLSRAPLGLALSGGIEVCLVGAPNSGKSSLFNALLSRERAIVTEVPGTTRDVLREHTEWRGIPVVLLDTAGLRETSDVVETIGVERAERAASESEVIVYVVDDTQGLTQEDRRWVSKWVAQGRRVLVVVSKTDIGSGQVRLEELDLAFRGAYVFASSVTGRGLEEIKSKVTEWFSHGEDLHGLAPGSARQVDCLRRAAESLGQALSRLSEGWSEDIVVLSLEEAARALAELTGKDVSEETLAQVFSRFCVGK